MKRFARLLLFAACFTSVPAHAININADSNLIDQGIDPAPAQTPTILGDIPLMNGLQVYHDKQLLDILPGDSENPVTAVGIVDIDDVYDFYKKTLPPLGWQLSGDRDYLRNGAHLHINAQADGKLSTVTFDETSAP